MIEQYLVAFLTAFGLSVVLVFAALWLARKIDWRGRDSARHIHDRAGVFRTGGLAVILAFNLAILLDRNLFISPELYGLMIGSILLMAIGIWDDLRELRWKIQLFFQVVISIIVFIMGVRIYFITNPLTGGIINFDSSVGVIASVFLLLVWIILVINSMNWMDGIDGLSGGVTFIAALTIFFLSLKPEVNQPPVAIISIILAGSVLGFLIFNFNPSRILAGTSGAMFMGFALAVLAIFSGTKIATALLVLVLPIIDFIWVIGERIKNHQSIFKPDRNHLHYKLLELGWSQKRINVLFYGVTAVVALVALNTRLVGKSITLVAAVVVIVGALILINKKIKKAVI